MDKRYENELGLKVIMKKIKYDVLIITLGSSLISTDLGVFVGIGIWLIALTIYTK